MNKCYSYTHYTQCSNIPMVPNHLINIYIKGWQTVAYSLNTASGLFL